MTLDQWIIRWGLPAAAITELRDVLTTDHAPPPADPANLASEARTQSQVRLDAAASGVWLTRNNVGAYQDPKSDRWIRYGLANESKGQNTLIKSADLIGFRPRVIIVTDIGKTIAQFVSRECKAEGWKPSATNPREQAQARWRDFINAHGGDAAFATGYGSFNYDR
jgi:hypothetical protein